MELSHNEMNDLMSRFPNFELSYETISHKKVSPSYNICLAIPQGKKCFLWFTFQGEKDCCILLDLNREKKIVKGTVINTIFDAKLSLGTLLYGTFIENEETNNIGKSLNFFAIEDIFYFKGIALKKLNLHEKFCSMIDTINSTNNSKNQIKFNLPVLWEIHNDQEVECATSIPDNISQTIPYQIHHIQYRCLTEIKPFLNVFINRKLNFSNAVTQESKKEKIHNFDTIDFTCDYSKPQYRYPTVFQVTADIQFDVYHLFAHGTNLKPIYYGVAGIPSYKTSVFMNSLFRKIKENINLDSIEESDDEEEFEDMTEDKFVDIQKVLLMECTFHQKFKKWIPTRVVENFSRIIHIDKLTGVPNKRPDGPTYFNQRNNIQKNYRPIHHGQRNNNQFNNNRPYNNKSNPSSNYSISTGI